MRYKWNLFLLPVLILAMASACQSDIGAQNQEVKSYDEDGYLGWTNSNPNLQTSPTYHTYQEDLDLIERTLGRMKQVQRSTVFINGDMIYVTVQPVREADADQVRSETYKALSYMLPRYDFKVAVRD
jgi:hypothetical protein